MDKPVFWEVFSLTTEQRALLFVRPILPVKFWIFSCYQFTPLFFLYPLNTKTPTHRLLRFWWHFIYKTSRDLVIVFGKRGVGVEGVCLVRNWFSLALRQGWKVIALTMTSPSGGDTESLCVWSFWVRVITCLHSTYMFVACSVFVLFYFYYVFCLYLSGGVCCWLCDEVCLIRPRQKYRRRSRVIPKGERSIRKDTPRRQRHHAHHLLHTQIAHSCRYTLQHKLQHTRNKSNTHVSTLLTALFLAVPQVPLHWHVTDGHINK